MKVRLDGCQNSRDIIDGAPLVLQNVQTDLSVCVNVRVEHSDQKFDLWFDFFSFRTIWCCKTRTCFQNTLIIHKLTNNCCNFTNDVSCCWKLILDVIISKCINDLTVESWLNLNFENKIRSEACLGTLPWKWPTMETFRLPKEFHRARKSLLSTAKYCPLQDWRWSVDVLRNHDKIGICEWTPTLAWHGKYYNGSERIFKIYFKKWNCTPGGGSLWIFLKSLINRRPAVEFAAIIAQMTVDLGVWWNVGSRNSRTQTDSALRCRV